MADKLMKLCLMMAVFVALLTCINSAIDAHAWVRGFYAFSAFGWTTVIVAIYRARIEWR